MPSAELDSKCQRWKDIQNELLHKCDKKGKPIDSGILDVLTGFVALGINTTQSCEGHLEKGIKGPWIEISAKHTDEIEFMEQQLQYLSGEISRVRQSEADPNFLSVLNRELFSVKKELRRKHLEEICKIEPHLMRFYDQRQTPFDRRIIIKINDFSGRVQCQGTEHQELRSFDEQIVKLQEYQQEMSAFGRFLFNEFHNLPHQD